MAVTGYDITQATVITDLALTDHVPVIKDGALYKVTGTELQSVIGDSSSPSLKVVTKSSTYTVAVTDNVVIADTDTTGANLTLNLSAATAYWNAADTLSKMITIINSGATYDAVLTPNGSETIDGASTLTVAAGANASVITDGSNWFSWAT